MKRKCKVCGKKIKIANWQIKQGIGKYCSVKCKNKGIVKKRIKLKCKYCGKSYTPKYPCIAKNSKYCSRHCSNLGRQIRKRINCKYCGKYFLLKPYRVSKKGNYCSIQCFGKDQYNQKAVKCKVCGKEFTTNKARSRRYCSEKCSRLGQTTKLKRRCLECGKVFYRVPAAVIKDGGNYCCRKCHDVHKRTSKTFKCRICGKPFEAFVSTIKRTKNVKNLVCSRKCFRLAVFGKGNPRWLGGLSFEPYPAGFNTILKNIVRERDKYRCQLCGKTQKQNKALLHVHHIDYDKDNLNPANLISLCVSCHGKTTHKNRKYWTKHFKKEIGAIYSSLRKQKSI